MPPKFDPGSIIEVRFGCDGDTDDGFSTFTWRLKLLFLFEN